MCGIITVIRKDNKQAGKMIAKLYQKQKSRGSDGFGYVAIKTITNGIDSIVRKTKEADILAELEKEKSSFIMFHHRFPTSTPNFAEATHPIAVESRFLKHNYYVIHNGIISNDNDLKTLQEKDGFEYQTAIRKEWITKGKTYFSEMFNDSEAFAIDLALYLDGKQTALTAKGSIAFVCLETDKQGYLKAIHYGRNEGSPLKLEDNKGFLTITSEGGSETVKPDVLYTIDPMTYVATSRMLRIGEAPKWTSGYWDRDYPSGFSSGKDSDLIPDQDEELADLQEEARELEKEILKAEQDGNEEVIDRLYGELGEVEFQITTLEREMLC